MARESLTTKVAGSRRASNLDAHIGATLRLRRLLLGLSQQELAEKVGLTFQQIQKYENGTNRIAASRLYEFAGILGVPLKSFFEDAPSAQNGAHLVDAAAASPIMDALATPQGVALNKAFLAIRDPRQRRALVTLVCSLASATSDANGTG
jgi:transcriptional regulator with XRE-family HTH domain